MKRCGSTERACEDEALGEWVELRRYDGERWLRHRQHLIGPVVERVDLDELALARGGTDERDVKLAQPLARIRLLDGERARRACTRRERRGEPRPIRCAVAVQPCRGVLGEIEAGLAGECGDQLVDGERVGVAE